MIKYLRPNLLTALLPNSASKVPKPEGVKTIASPVWPTYHQPHFSFVKNETHLELHDLVKGIPI